MLTHRSLWCQQQQQQQTASMKRDGNFNFIFYNDDDNNYDARNDEIPVGPRPYLPTISPLQYQTFPPVPPNVRL
jgi:hypothetical protein